jgi:pimeloyl-ACP methyl ester carboxylesterase
LRSALSRLLSSRQPVTGEPGNAGLSREAAIAAIWSELVGRSARGSDEWFASGGRILTAYVLFERLEQLVGRTLPLSALFTWHTLARLQRYVAGEDRPAVTRRFADLSGGRGARVVYVPGSHGEDFHARSLLAALGRPIRWFRSEGLDRGSPPPPTTLEDMADDYCRLMGVPDRRPLVLAGYSMGGCVAWLMAERLERQGRDVRAVLLLDTFPPGFGDPVDQEPDDFYSNHLNTVIEDAADRPSMRHLPVPQKTRRSEVDHDVMGHFLRSAGLLPPGLSFGPYDRRLWVLAIGHCVTRTFQPPRWTGPVVHLVSGEMADSPGFGPPTRRIEVGGDHRSFLFEPQHPSAIDRVLQELGL